jgi:uncharacterized protein
MPPTVVKEALVPVRVTPRASRNKILGWRADGILAVRVTAAPVDGQANAAAARLLATVLGLSRAAVAVVRGARGRDKLVRITGLNAGEVRSRLGMKEDGRCGV